jgi:diaminopimelate decarboxylase
LSTENAKSYLSYQGADLHFGLFPMGLERFSQKYDKPVYIYDLEIVKSRFQKMKAALPGVGIYYAMKANSNLDILRALKTEGAKIDVVSRGEIARALEAGFAPQDIVFSGVGKTVKDLERAIELSIHQINVESAPELLRIAEMAKEKNRKVAIALRLNPNISIDTHPYIATGLHENKFGIELSVLPEIQGILQRHQDQIELKALSLHLGSQMLEFSGLREALQILKKVYKDLQSQFPSLQRFDFGGGLGINYETTDLMQEQQDLNSYAKVVLAELSELKAELQTEPGRWIVAHAGVLLAQVQYVKETPYRTFLVLDSGMNHLIRPALYQAHHQIFSLRLRGSGQKVYDVVGPICESADFFAKERRLAECFQNDFLVIADAGAYGYSMANTYNLQDLPSEFSFFSRKS